ncbi:MAG: L-threonine 3-dehydrogenase [Planctomycetota bacterium]|jgi:threonine 3-dehydrogenase|nr:L-threonine 3-dehydrogenase [Planctomycetota bacterium]
MSHVPDQMLAIKKTEAAPGLTWSPETKIPPIGPREALIRVTHAGICGTDRHIFEWDAWSASRVKIGITTGHEFVGVVEKTGSAVTRTQIGDRVSAEGHIGCGNCQPCRTGKGHICENVDILGIDCNGCFAQWVAVPEENIWPVHPKIPDRIAAVFDPLGNAVHTVMAAGVSGKSVLITGVGIIGLMAVTVAKAAGAAKILVSDIDPNRLELARKLGANETFDAKQEWVRDARQATHQQGPEVLLEMSGHPAAIKSGFQSLRNGGTAALLGLPANDVSFNLADEIIFKGAKVLGINGRLMFETWYQMESFLLSGRLEMDPIVTHEIEMANFQKGFELMQSGEGIKIVMEMPTV